MDFNAYGPTCLHLGDTYIRVYNSFPVQNIYHQGQRCFDPSYITQLLYNSHPLQYPYMWYVYGDQACIVNYDDVFQYPSFPTIIDQWDAGQSYAPIDDGVLIPDEVETDRTTNESFDQAASHVQYLFSGLTASFISKNLQATTYCEEEGEDNEICVVCQVEFESNERLAALQCKHRYHQRCITLWLVRQNVCPICKAQGLSQV